MEKKTIFISHSTPQDNYFSVWLSSKLNMFGYNTWVDINDVSVGTAFSAEVPKIIEEQSVIFISVVSQSYSDKAKEQNSGVFAELVCAKSISSEFSHEFIIPIKIDSIDYKSLPYDIRNRKAIDFYGNWGKGLSELVKTLEDFKIPKSDNIVNPIEKWFQVIKSEKKVMEKEEELYTNWIEISLPKKIYVHKLPLRKVPKLYEPEHRNRYPFILEAYYIISFFNASSISDDLEVIESYTYDTTLFQQNQTIRVNDEFQVKFSVHKLKYLLNETAKYHLRISDMKEKQNTRGRVFYFKHEQKEVRSKLISLKRYGKTRKSLTGNISNQNWALSLSLMAHYIEDRFFYSVKYSLVFTNDQYHELSVEDQHKYRRSIASGWFNKDWFYLLLASLIKISPSEESESIEMLIGNDLHMSVSNNPLSYKTIFGYNEE